MLFLQYPPCSTCQKAKKWLDDHGIEYTARHIKEDNPTADELREWVARSGLPLKRFFTTRDRGRTDRPAGVGRYARQAPAAGGRRFCPARL